MRLYNIETKLSSLAYSHACLILPYVLTSHIHTHTTYAHTHTHTCSASKIRRIEESVYMFFLLLKICYHTLLNYTPSRSPSRSRLKHDTNIIYKRNSRIITFSLEQLKLPLKERERDRLERRNHEIQIT